MMGKLVGLAPALLSLIEKIVDAIVAAPPDQRADVARKALLATGYGEIGDRAMDAALRAKKKVTS